MARKKTASAGDESPKKRMKKTGDLFSVGSIQKTGAYNVTQASSFFYSPELTSESWLLPKSRQEVLKWARIFYNLEPYIGAITDTHASFPFSKFELTTPDPSITEFYEEMAFNEHFDLYQYVLRASLSYQKFGEALPFGNMQQGEDKKWRWTKFILLEPELVEIRHDVFGETAPVFEMIPTEEIKTLVRSTKPEDAERLQALKENAPEVIDAVNENRNILLNSDNISQIAMLTDASATRGTTPLQRLFKVCLAGNSKLALLDGTNPTLEELYRAGAKNFWVYSVNPATKEIVPVQADGIVYNGEREVLEITLDNGSVLKCTPDHKLYLRDGSTKEAQFLQSGDSLMPLYRTYHKQYEKANKNAAIYERVYNPATDKYVLTHVLTVLNHKRAETKGKGKYVIHHQNVHGFDGGKPFYSLDNTPENLLVLTRAEHGKLHRAFAASRERMTELSQLAAIARNVNDKHSKRMLALWANPAYKAEVTAQIKSSLAEMPAERRLQNQRKRSAASRQAIVEKQNRRLAFLQTASKEFQKDQGRLPTVKELASAVGWCYATTCWTVNKFGPNVVGVNLKRRKTSTILNHTVVSVTRTGEVTSVYDVVNSGPHHNFFTSFDDKSGVAVSNCVYQDWIRLAQSAYAQRYVFPVELWTIGDVEKNIMPTENDLLNFRTLINQAIQNPPFSMVFPPIVKYEALSTMGKNFPVNNEYEYIQDQIMVGLGMNRNILLGDGPSFSNVKTMALTMLISKYKNIRDTFENWMLNHFFRPIAKKNNFYTTERGKKKLILPTINWHKSLDIEAEDDERNTFKEFHEQGILSTKTLFTKYPNLDFEEERKNLEAEVGTIFDKGGGKGRLPKAISKPSGGGGAGGPVSTDMDLAGPEPTEPIEPGAPQSGEGQEVGSPEEAANATPVPGATPPTSEAL